MKYTNINFDYITEKAAAVEEVAGQRRKKAGMSVGQEKKYKLAQAQRQAAGQPRASRPEWLASQQPATVQPDLPMDIPLGGPPQPAHGQQHLPGITPGTPPESAPQPDPNQMVMDLPHPQQQELDLTGAGELSPPPVEEPPVEPHVEEPPVDPVVPPVEEPPVEEPPVDEPPVDETGMDPVGTIIHAINNNVLTPADVITFLMGKNPPGYKSDFLTRDQQEEQARKWLWVKNFLDPSMLASLERGEAGGSKKTEDGGAGPGAAGPGAAGPGAAVPGGGGPTDVGVRTDVGQRQGDIHFAPNITIGDVTAGGGGGGGGAKANVDMSQQGGIMPGPVPVPGDARVGGPTPIDAGPYVDVQGVDDTPKIGYTGEVPKITSGEGPPLLPAPKPEPEPKPSLRDRILKGPVPQPDVSDELIELPMKDTPPEVADGMTSAQKRLKSQAQQSRRALQRFNDGKSPSKTDKKLLRRLRYARQEGNKITKAGGEFLDAWERGKSVRPEPGRPWEMSERPIRDNPATGTTKDLSSYKPKGKLVEGYKFSGQQWFEVKETDTSKYME